MYWVSSKQVSPEHQNKAVALKLQGNNFPFNDVHAEQLEVSLHKP